MLNKYYITFGQNHTHTIAGKNFDHDTIAVIEAENEEDLANKAIEFFGSRFDNYYNEFEKPDLEFYPGGLVYL